MEKNKNKTIVRPDVATDEEQILPMLLSKNHFLKVFQEGDDLQNETSDPYDAHILMKAMKTVFPKTEKTSDYNQHGKTDKAPEYNQHGCTIILMGETGCGKSTQVPQILHEYWKNRYGYPFNMAVTEPRRLAAVTLSTRVASEMAETYKTQDVVGYTVRFQSNSTKKTKITYLTEGILLQEIMSDEYLSKYNVVVVDEAHERSISTDIILSYLKKLVHYRFKAAEHAKRESLKLRVIIMTATGEAELFRNFFPGSQSVLVKGRSHDVDICFLKPHRAQDDYLSSTMAVVMKLHDELPPEDHILVFLTGQEEIEGVVRQLRSMKHHVKVAVCPLYAALSENSQQDAFIIPKDGIRKIVVATNIAETSLTIPGIKVVVDSGFIKSKFYITSYALEAYQIRRISKSQAGQRAGRAGRVQEGKTFRVYSKETYSRMSDYEQPEITRSCLSQLFLILPHFNKLDGKELKFMNPISSDTKADAKLELEALGLMDSQGLLTELGSVLGRFPLEPKLAKVVWDSACWGVLNQVCAIVGMMETENIFSRCNEEEHAKTMQKFVAPEGDLLTYWNIFRQFSKSKFPKMFCDSNKLNLRALQHAVKVKTQLMELVSKRLAALSLEYKTKFDDQANESILKCFAMNIPWNRASLDKSGKFYNIERIPKRQNIEDTWRPVKPLRAKIHPSSSLVLAKPPRIFFLKITLNDNQDMFLHHCAVFDKTMESFK